MSEEAAFLVDMVLPKSRYRQWTFTFPWPIRRLMARDYTLLTAILTLVIRALYAYQRRMARRAGHRGAKCASVTFVQRAFGGALNANVHLHVLAPDAVFMPGETEDDVLRMVPLPVPEDKEILGILQKVVRRVSALVQKRCGLDDDLGLEPETDVLDGAIDEAMRNVPRLPWTADDEEPSDEAPQGSPNACRTGKRAMRLEGFSLHANTAVAADNRFGLEKLCSYGMRPPFAHERLSLTEDGRVRLELKRPWPTADGASALIFATVRPSDPLSWLVCSTSPRSRPVAGRTRDRHSPRGLGACGPARAGPRQLESQQGRRQAQKPGTGLPGPNAGGGDERGHCTDVWRRPRPPVDPCRAHLTAFHETAAGSSSSCGASIIATGAARLDRAAQAPEVA